MSPYRAERLEEERLHLRRMPGRNKRASPETVQRLERIEFELRRETGFEGVGHNADRLS